jgi:fructose-bisphosphate aldolase, class II
LTDPDEAADFVAKTGVDALAVAIGTSHGAYKFTKQADRRSPGDGPHRGDPQEAAQLPPGDARQSSACRRNCRTIINKYGGQMKQTWGVPVEEIQRGIKHGVRKINVDTDNRMAITAAIRKVLWETPRSSTPATT